MNNIPKHIAIVMDGNGRWAKNKNLKRTEGHIEGEKVFRQVCKDAESLGVEIVTVFAFSTENWERSEEEVNKIMLVLQQYFISCKNFAESSNYKIKVLGERKRLSKELNDAITDAEKTTENNNGLLIQIAINYGGKNEIVRAVNKLLKSNVTTITEKDIENNLDTYGCDAPDLLIRTGGEIRLSNFMIWQLAYTELYFTDILWPDFNKEELIRAIEYYKSKERRFGGIK